jgi:hypothetical protein
MCDLDETKAEFADRLQHLMSLPLESAADVTHWDAQRFLVEESFKDTLPELLVTAEIAHFFDDADIRAKDHSYRDFQHDLIRRRIADLRKVASAAASRES